MKKIAALLMVMFIVGGLRAQVLESYRGAVDDSYNFWLYTPASSDSIAQKPLIVFLHGQSICGRNMDRVRRYGPLNALEMGMEIDAMVLAPLNPGGSWNPRKVIRLVDWAVAHHAVDTNRIYLIGMSLGGFGTLDVAGTYPDRFAAAMALCGGSTLRDYCGLNRLPLWIMHGTADRAVGIAASQRVVDAMEACDSTHRLIWTQLPGANHGRLARVFYLPETYEWLLSHSLADSGRDVNRSYDITVDDLGRGKEIYRKVRAMGNKVKVTTGGKWKTENDKRSTGNEEQYADAGTVEDPEDFIIAEMAKENGGMEAESGEQPKATYHTIRRGDTLYKLSRRYGTTIKALCRLNNIRENATLRVGKRLRVR